MKKTTSSLFYYISISLVLITATAKAQAPANDNCTGAILMPPQSTCFIPVTGTLTNATSSGYTSCPGNSNIDVWYLFYPCSTAEIIDVTGSSGFFPVFEVFSGNNCASLTSLGCFVGSPGGTAYANLTTLTLAPYRVRVANFSGVPSTPTFTICAASCVVVDGVEQENTGTDIISIAPNPFTYQTQLTFDKKINNARVKIINMLGETVYETVIPAGEKSFTIDRGTMKEGIYFLQLIDESIDNKTIKPIIYKKIIID